jgi:hypothetical protein
VNRIRHLYAWVIDEPDGEAMVFGEVQATPPVMVLLTTSRPENFERFKEAAQSAANRRGKPLRLIQAQVEGYIDEVTPVVPPPATATMPPPNEDDDDL